jgi:hypothetical protein
VIGRQVTKSAKRPALEIVRAVRFAANAEFDFPRKATGEIGAIDLDSRLDLGRRWTTPRHPINARERPGAGRARSVDRH